MLIKTSFKQQKVPLNPPLFHEDIFGRIFNGIFCKTISLIKNNSEIPSRLHNFTYNCLSSVSFSQDDIAELIQDLNPNKAHGRDKIAFAS